VETVGICGMLAEGEYSPKRRTNMGMRKILDGETKSNILHPAPLTSVDTNKLKCMIFHIKKR
jgi:hypothetical protein